MIVKFCGYSYDCSAAYRSGSSVILQLPGGGRVKFYGVTSDARFAVEGGVMQTIEPQLSEEARLAALESAIERGLTL